MSAQNQAVNRALRRYVRPRLQAAGFEDFTDRKAWRCTDDAIQVVNFQAVGGYAAEGVGCTPFSFSVFAGVLYRDCDDWDGNPAKHLVRPDYPQCHFEIILGKRLRQPHAFHPQGRERGVSRADTWAVWEDASNVDEVVEDAADTLVATGLPLLAEFSSPDLAYAALLSRDSSPVRHGKPGVGMPGAPGSPRWTQTVRCLGRKLGRDVNQDVSNAPVFTAAPLQ